MGINSIPPRISILLRSMMMFDRLCVNKIERGLMRKREPKETDQDQIEIAFRLLGIYMKNHTEIEPTLWLGAFWGILVHTYSEAGVSYEEFTKEWDKLKTFYKPWFDK